MGHLRRSLKLLKLVRSHFLRKVTSSFVNHKLQLAVVIKQKIRQDLPLRQDWPCSLMLIHRVLPKVYKHSSGDMIETQTTLVTTGLDV